MTRLGLTLAFLAGAAFHLAAILLMALTLLDRTPAVSAAPIDDALYRAERDLRDAERLQAIEVEQANQREAIEALCLQSRVLVRRGDSRGELIAAAREACPLPEVSP